LDKLVGEYQGAGFVNLMIVVKSFSPWGTTPLTTASNQEFAKTRGAPPREEYWGAYADFVQNLVERYDGDGTDDMPNLRAPVRYYEIESEAQHPGYWQGTLADYARVLKTAYQAAKRANPATQIVLSGISMSDVFDDQPSEAVVAQRMAGLPPLYRRALEFIRGSLRLQDAYDQVEFHYNFAPVSIYGTVNWLRSEMRQAGQVKPIWAGDAIAGPALGSNFVPPMPRAEADRIVAALSNPQDPQHAAVKRDYEAAQARNLVKKVVLALEARLAGIMMGNLEDWPDYKILNNTWVWQGLINPDGSRRPAFYAYKIARQKLDQQQQVTRLDLGPDVFAFEVSRSDGTLYVLWAGRGPKEVRLPVAFERAQITSSVTQDPRGTPQVFQAEAQQGALRLPLTTTPIFVEAR
jgi:hypothetical protein